MMEVGVLAVWNKLPGSVTFGTTMTKAGSSKGTDPQVAGGALPRIRRGFSHGARLPRWFHCHHCFGSGNGLIYCQSRQGRAFCLDSLEHYFSTKPGSSNWVITRPDQCCSTQLQSLKVQ